MKEGVTAVIEIVIDRGEITENYIHAIYEYEFITPKGLPIKKSVVINDKAVEIVLSVSSYMTENRDDAQNFAGSLTHILYSAIQEFEDTYYTDIISKNIIGDRVRFYS